MILRPFLTLLEPETSVSDNPALATSLKAYSSLIKEQKIVLSRTLDGFISCLAPVAGSLHANPHARTVINEEAWNHRASWGRDEWNAFETWGWYRHFCRLVSDCSFCFRSRCDLIHLIHHSTLRTSVCMLTLWTPSRFPN